MATMQAQRPDTDASVDRLQRQLSGAVVRPGDADYDTARAVWNGMIDRRPALIVSCAGVQDVVKAIGFARARIASGGARRRSQRRGQFRVR